MKPLRLCRRVWTVRNVYRTGTNCLDECTDAVTLYISFCEDSCVPTCTGVSYNNDKPWSGDKDMFKESKYWFSREVREVKLQQQFSANDSTSVWKGLRQVTNCMPKAPYSINNARMASELNEFYGRFKR